MTNNQSVTDNVEQATIAETLQDKPRWLANFITAYQSLSANNLAQLNNVYHQNVVFIDPAHRLTGIDDLLLYFSKLYQHIDSCEFVIEQLITEANSAAVYWQMTLQHPKLNQGAAITVSGHSLLKAMDNKVIYHRDYFDLGAMLYEQLPILGPIVRWLKQRMNS
ncbi:nuclear transport factor 2 family protein [Thalassotalea sp. G2M2-11]|uniref:nuclear transport factor 2 family protein n=1 Tax=Thalassotalea sp. G2M2-11 TaxID=2787627 RepID=UPI0019CF7C53|nr:nuclear transport factor 2 family protein [Thalassotalea sp. G2M2-11]